MRCSSPLIIFVGFSPLSLPQFCTEEPVLDPELQMYPHLRRPDRNDHLPWPADYTLCRATQNAFGLLCSKGRLLTKLVVQEDLQGSRIARFITFSGVEVGLTGLLLLGFSILKTGVTFAFFQFSGTSFNCHDLSELKSGLALRLLSFLGSHAFIVSGPRDWCVSRLSGLQPDSPSQRASRLLPLVSGLGSSGPWD